MSKSLFAKLLVAELLVIGLVVLVFRVFHERLVAGAVAGSIFVSLGSWILWVGLRSRSFRSTFTFWAGCAHLFLSALPLMVTRFLNQSASFTDVRVLGLPGPVFHQLSTGIYFVLLLATIVDQVRFWRRGQLKA